MMLQMKSMPCAIACALASGALSVVANPAMAQQGADAQPVQRVVVTGSLISRADKETPSPVQVLTSEDLIKSGRTSVAEVLSNLSANGQGALSTGFPGAFANGGSGVSLRGLTVGLTLVLIDGHRMAPYPLSDDAQRQFVDVSSIPFDAIDRIEVLKDGASSIYGSDAIAGVVNIILKKTFKGTTVRSEVGNSQHGGGAAWKTSVMSGIGDLDNDGYNAFGSIEYRHSNQIKVSDRDNMLFANYDWTARGGSNLTRGVPTSINSFLIQPSTPMLYSPTKNPGVPGMSAVDNPANYQFLDPSCNFVKFRAGQCTLRDTYSILQPESENLNLLAGFTKKLNEDWTLALKASMFRRESENNRGVPLTFSTASFPGFTALVPNKAPAIVNTIKNTTIPLGVQGNTLAGDARLYGYIPGLPGANTSDNTSTSYRYAADLTGSVAGWDVSAAAGYTRVVTDIDYSGYVNRVALYNALTRSTNRFNALGGNSQALLDEVAPHFSNQATAELIYGNLQATRELFQLPGGALAFGAGLSYVKKDLNSPSALLLQQGIVGNGSAYVMGKETNTAAYVDLAAPVIKGLELDGSARYDHFDTYGHSFTPKAGFKWTPVQMLGVRGTFAKGFRAPNAAENGVAGSTFSAGSIDDPILCAGGDPNRAGNVPATCNFAPAYVQVTSPKIQPETSKSYTFGLIVQPMQDVSATLDFYKIKVDGQINTASGLPGFVPDYVRNVPLPQQISDGKGGTFTGTPSVGTIAYATSGYVNVGSTETRGVELDVTGRRRMGDLGTLRSQLTFTHLISYKITNPDGSFELAGTHGPSIIGGDTGTPKDKAQLTLGWDKGPLSVSSTFNWVGSYSALDPAIGVTDCRDATAVSGRNYFFNLKDKSGNHTPQNYCEVSSFMTVDLNLTYQLSKTVQLKASVLNLFDREPPIDVATYGSAGSTAYNPTLHQAGAVGRYLSIGANLTF